MAQQDRDPTTDELAQVLRKMAKWRSLMLARSLIAHNGTRVLAGPFRGMEYLEEATEGALCARLLGTYESELHPYIEGLGAAGISHVFDVGCAEGYYAVGIARILPEAKVWAYDIDPAARTACARLAASNGVAERVTIEGEFTTECLRLGNGHRALVLMDVEGAEGGLLSASAAPELAEALLIVETHPAISPGVTDDLQKRFTSTHRVDVVERSDKVAERPPWMASLGDLDQLLSVWEWRHLPTPWLIMTPRAW